MSPGVDLSLDCRMAGPSLWHPDEMTAPAQPPVLGPFFDSGLARREGIARPGLPRIVVHRLFAML